MAESSDQCSGGRRQVDFCRNNADSIEQLYRQCKQQLNMAASTLSKDQSVSDNDKKAFKFRTQEFSLWTLNLTEQLHYEDYGRFDAELAKRLSVNPYISNFMIYIFQAILKSLNRQSMASNISEAVNSLKINIALLKGLIGVLSNRILMSQKHQKYKIRHVRNNDIERVHSVLSTSDSTLPGILVACANPSIYRRGVSNAGLDDSISNFSNEQTEISASVICDLCKHKVILSDHAVR
jgi:hypothetical protein